MQNEIFTLLKKVEGSKKIVSIHHVADEASGEVSISFGFIDIVNKKEVRIHVVSTQGEDAGFDVVRLSRICQVDICGKYEKKFEFLYKNKKRIPVSTKLSSRIRNKDIFVTTLKEAFQRELVVAIWTKDVEGSVVGNIKSIGAKTVVLNVIDDYGEDDGLTIIKLDKIDFMECDTTKLRIRKFLYENRSS